MYFQTNAGENAASTEDYSVGKYGVLPMNQSKASDKQKYQFVNIKKLDNSFIDKEVWIRGRIHTTRGKG